MLDSQDVLCGNVFDGDAWTFLRSIDFPVAEVTHDVTQLLGVEECLEAVSGFTLDL